MASPKRFSAGVLSGKTYLGLDPSYGGFGLTALSADGSFDSEVFTHPGKGVFRLALFRDHLTDWLAKLQSNGGLERAAIEGYAYAARNGGALSGELGGVVRLALFDHGVPDVWVVPPTTLKKYVLGSGTGSKSQVMLGVFRKWSVDLPDDNAADSYALARIARGDTQFDYEADIIKNLRSRARA
jgi:Holliday junction resolvasome RuvABC endonuclease subunit